MADSFFGLDTLSSNLNDDEGGGEPSEDEYDALNDETFGQDSDAFDWEVEHEQLAEQLESSRRHNIGIDDSANSQLEASLSQLVLDDIDGPQARAFGSSVWRHDAPFGAPTPVPVLKNVCTVEELERQLRQKQPQQPYRQNFYQPGFPPVILQRPPGLQAPVSLPFAPQQSMSHNMNQMNQPLNKIIGQNTQLSQMTQGLMQNQMGQNMNQMGQGVNQMGQNINQMGQNMNQMGQNMNQIGSSVNQMGSNVNQFMQNANQMSNFQNNQMGQNNMMNLSQNMQVHQIGQSNQLLNQMTQNVNPMGQNLNQMGQNLNQMSQNINQMAQNVNPLGQNVNQMSQNLNQMGQNINQIGQNVNPIGQNQMGQNMNQMAQNMNQLSQNPIGQNQMGQNLNQMGQNINQMGQNVSQMMPNGNQFNPGMNQFPHMMGQPRMMAPPPGMGIPRQNFSQNVGQFNPNFRAPTIPMKNEPPPINQNMMMNQHQQMKNQSTQINNKTIGSQINQQTNQQPLNQPVNQQINQSPQNKVQKPAQNRADQKTSTPVQKSRVYNNSKNMASQNFGSQKITPQMLTPQNLFSQNMAQLIQNTQQLIYNNSYHNASHHPILNNRNNMFNNQFANNHMFNNQRVNGIYSNNNRHSMNGDDASSGSECDEYAGLMTPREKQWLVNIQMLQLNTGTPYIHDFYYTVFLERQASKEKEGIKEAHKANQQNHPLYSGGVKQETHPHQRERHNSNRHNSTSEDSAPRTYVPTQFENSLGKLQCGSVTAPRKIIDVEVVAGESASGRVSRAASVASTTNPAEVPREMRRTKQLLLDIEALYLILLRLEELSDPLAISNALILKEREEKQKQLELAQKEALENEQEDESNVFLRNIESVQRRPKQDSPKSESIDKRQVVNLAVNQKPVPVKNLLDEDKDDLMNKMFLGLLHTDKVAQMLTVRKGRTLLSRFVSRVPAGHNRLRALWARVLRALPAAARRSDHGLPALAPHYRRYIQNTTGWSAVLESSSLLSEAFDPARTPHALTTSFTLSCVCALIERATILVNTPEATSNERQWSKFLKTLARSLKNTTVNVAKPLYPLPESKLLCHLKQLDSRSTIEILQRGKSAAEYTEVTKADVTHQLTKHLC